MRFKILFLAIIMIFAAVIMPVQNDVCEQSITVNVQESNISGGEVLYEDLGEWPEILSFYDYKFEFLYFNEPKDMIDYKLIKANKYEFVNYEHFINKDSNYSNT
jgi:hypothetical protein